MYCEPLLLITMKKINRETFFVFFLNTAYLQETTTTQ